MPCWGQPGLYLGSATAAEDLTGLKKHHVTHIVNVADDVPNYHEDTGCFKYLNLQVADFGKDKGISRVFEQAAKFVATALGWPHASDTSTGVGDDGGTVATTTTTAPASAGTGEAVVLVHCAAGRNRSVAVVLGVLMVAQNMSLKQAHTTMLKVRATVCPFRDNRKELVAFELRTRGKSTLGEASFA